MRLRVGGDELAQRDGFCASQFAIMLLQPLAAATSIAALYWAGSLSHYPVFTRG
jgi:hypothetical protein